jgi:ABC-type lipoprotein export system ATPase subunit
VLFIDEAPSLLKTVQGCEVIDKLLTTIEDTDIMKDVCIILAGYEHAMYELFDYDIGLQSRFDAPNAIVKFENYTAKQLVGIMDSFAQKADTDPYIKAPFKLDVSDENVIKLSTHTPDVLSDIYRELIEAESLPVSLRNKLAILPTLSIDEALEFFKNIPGIKRKLETLHDVGLGYIRLGQPATTLSGGEAQRVKLSSELQKRQTGKTFYILDEPTTGLHFEDVSQLLEVLQRLVDAGNTVLVIEHNLDVVKSADRIIDLGPEGGDRGGSIVATGTPEEVAKVKESYTGQFLARMLG